MGLVAITWTRLHERLGIEARGLTYNDVLAVVQQQLGEDAQLEWKGERRSEEHAKAELAKDLAAMANSGGGLIVFGVGEEIRGDGTKVIVNSDVALDEHAEQYVRSVAWGRVRPLIAGVEIEFLENPERPGRGALAVWVPPSPDAPHFYEKNGQPPAAPWRDGPHTEHLREREIERAYRDRFRRQDDAGLALDWLVQGAKERLALRGPRGARWTVVAARPLSGPALGVRPPDREGVRALLAQIEARERDIFIERNAMGSGFASQVQHDPSVGLRRWIFVVRAHHEPNDGLASYTLCEMHHDGSTTLAFASAEPPEGVDQRPRLSHARVEHTIGSAIALARVWAGALRVPGPISMRATVLNSPNTPFWLLSPSGERKSPSISAGSAPLTRVEPVDSLLDARADLGPDLDVAHDLVRGIVNQFGIDTVHTLQGTADRGTA